MTVLLIPKGKIYIGLLLTDMIYVIFSVCCYHIYIDHRRHTGIGLTGEGWKSLYKNSYQGTRDCKTLVDFNIIAKTVLPDQIYLLKAPVSR